MAQQHLDLSPGGDKVGEAFEKVEANQAELYALVAALTAALQGVTNLAPDQLNTFAEIAAALANDPNYAANAAQDALISAIVFG